MEGVYLDHNARVPLRAQAAHAMAQGAQLAGNPSSAHAHGQAARAALEHARSQVAALLGASEKSVTFTSGATEALHLALHGLLTSQQPAVVLTCATEHHAVLLELEWLCSTQRAAVVTVPVLPNGSVDEAAWRAALNNHPVTVAMLMAVNNETGVVHANSARLLKYAREAGATTILDAAQRVGRLPLNALTCGADFVALSACKFGGPPGVGALWMGPAGQQRWRAPHRGGSQEKGKRPGTENLLGALGMGAAAQAAQQDLDVWETQVAPLTATFETNLCAQFPSAVIHGLGAPRLGNTVFAGFPGVDAQTLLMLLDQAGVAASSGSACESGSMKPSHVLLAMGVTRELALASVRFSTGPSTTATQLEHVLHTLHTVLPLSRVSQG